MTRYAVIGSNCFTGCHIVNALLERAGTKVVGLSRSPEKSKLYLPYKRRAGLAGRFRFVQMDSVRQSDELIELLDELRPNVVINVAALSEVGLSNYSPVEYFEINTTAVVKLANALRERDWLERYVHISSAEIFGSLAEPATEEDKFNPSTPYAVSKAAADMYLNVIARNFGFPAVLIRSTNVYGAHQQLFKIIPRTVIRVRQGEVVELHGGGTSKKQFIHIRDVVDGLLATLDRGAVGTFHFTRHSEDTVADVVRTVCEQMGHNFEESSRVVGERLGQDTAYTLDTTRAERDLGWTPRVPFDQGVRETIEWIDMNWRAVLREPHVYHHKL